MSNTTVSDGRCAGLDRLSFKVQIRTLKRSGGPALLFVLCNESALLQLDGSEERPRLAVFRSINHIYAQVRDGSLRDSLATECL